MANPTPVSPPSNAQSPAAPQTSEDDDDDLPWPEDFVEPGESQSVPSPAPTQPSPAQPAPTVTVASSPPSSHPEVPDIGQHDIAADDELSILQLQKQAVKAHIIKLYEELGVNVMHNPEARKPGNLLHDVVYYMRWQPYVLSTMGAHRLAEYEVVLAAHQVYVASLENRADAHYSMLSREVSRVIRSRMGDVGATKVKEKEDEVLRQFPEIRKLHGEFQMAQAVHEALKGFGDRFAQLEDGIKRMIDLARMELTNDGMGTTYRQ